MRRQLAESLVSYGAKNMNMVVVDADVSNSTMTVAFQKAYPDRFFNVGIAEAGLVDLAVGLSLGGKLPFASAFAGVIANRALEQIRTSVAINKSNVKILAGYAGLSDYKDGPTHYSVFDLAIMRAMPNMTVMVACDSDELKDMIPIIAEFDGPVYLRISREEIPVVDKKGSMPKIGHGRFIRQGNDATIVVTGTPLYRCVEAIEALKSEGINAGIIELPTLKPFDEQLILDCAETTGALVTVEEHSIIGGLYGAVSECLARSKPTAVLPVGIRDRFMPTARDYSSLLDYAGISIAAIVAATRQVVRLKERSHGKG